jgi:4-diphosphocytidyl-2-C-methyl-D-erythritol kinase
MPFRHVDAVSRMWPRAGTAAEEMGFSMRAVPARVTRRPCVLWAPAKINLVLNVGERLTDGYHTVRTALQAVSLFDRLVLEPAAAVEVVCTAPGLGPPESNLAWRAATLLQRSAGVDTGVRIHLTKRIPAGAGLGGGSADAAATLLGCARLWGLDWERTRLGALAAQLGADVPFFLWGGTALAAGRGDRIQPLPPLPAWPGLLARVGPPLATAAMYAALDALGRWPRPDPRPVARLARHGPLPWDRHARHALARALGNSFEAVVYPRRGDVARLRADLLTAGALACVLCGSGSALFALAPTAAWAARVARRLRQAGIWSAPVRFWPKGPTLRGTPPSAEALGQGDDGPGA